jgi:hypothetical protein
MPAPVRPTGRTAHLVLVCRGVRQLDALTECRVDDAYSATDLIVLLDRDVVANEDDGDRREPDSQQNLQERIGCGSSEPTIAVGTETETSSRPGSRSKRARSWRSTATPTSRHATY